MDFNQTKCVVHHQWCVEGARALGKVIALPQAEHFRPNHSQFDCCISTYTVVGIGWNSHNYFPRQRILTKPSATSIANSVWKASVQSEGKSLQHRPSDFFITMHIKKPQFT